METITNSEMFEKVARREVSPEVAAAHLLAGDAERRRQRVVAAKPAWIPGVAWAAMTVAIVALIDVLQRRS